MEGRLQKAKRPTFFKISFRSDILGYNSKTMNGKSMKTQWLVSIQLMLTLE